MIVVEDGSGVANADSYITVAEARAYAAKRGFTTFDALTDGEVEAKIILAMDVVESYRGSFKGTKASSTQALQWPRADVYIDGTEIASTTIPTELKNALSQLSVDAVSSTLQPNLGGRTVTREKVDVVEIEYAARGASAEYTVFDKFETMLEPLLSSTGPLYTVRV